MTRIVVVSGHSRMLAAQLLALLEEHGFDVAEGVSGTVTTVDVTLPTAKLGRIAIEGPSPYYHEPRKAQWKQEIAGRPRPKILRK